MPAERNMALASRPLDFLYSKYAKNAARSSSSTPFTASPALAPRQVSASWNTLPTIGDEDQDQVKRMRVGRLHAPPRVKKSQAELGDLSKLGKELSKVERVHVLFNVSDTRKEHNNQQHRSHHNHAVTNGDGEAGGGGGRKDKSKRQPASSAYTDGQKCQECLQEHKPEDGHEKLRNLKSRLRLVTKASHSLPDCPQAGSPSVNGNSNTPVRNPLQRVVPLPMLKLTWQRNTSSEDLAALREARKATTYMLYPPATLKNTVGTVSAWGLGNWAHPEGDSSGGGSGIGTRPERLHNYRHSSDTSDETSPRMFGQQNVPACSAATDRYHMNGRHNHDDDDDESATTYDSDQVDRQQFEYVFEQHSDSYTSSDVSHDDSDTVESDAETYSARAQRPSTAGTSCTMRQMETRASMRRPMAMMSPAASPRQTWTRGSEAWPPPIVPNSWPALDDPYRFQYLGRGVHRDIMRRRHHKSRGRRRGRGESDSEKPTAPKTKLDVVVPSAQAECSRCGKYGDCKHTANAQSTTRTRTAAPSFRGPSVTGKSATSRRSSLAMSVCTVLPGVAQATQQQSHLKDVAAKGVSNGRVGVHHDDHHKDTISNGKNALSSNSGHSEKA